jgi:hypothetical protein
MCVDPQTNNTSAETQGETLLRTNLCIAGSSLFFDAARKTKKTQGTNQSITGTGVYYQLNEIHLMTTIFIQASMSVAPSVIQAEA